MNKVMLLLNTIKFLKPKQIYYRAFYLFRRKYRKVINFQYLYTKESNTLPLSMDESIDIGYSLYENNTFSFLNLSQKFDNTIDWNFSKYGKLWTYNLSYFEFLRKKEDVRLMYDFIENIENIKDGLEPFPISLRGISWIKFLTYNKLQDKTIDDSLYAQYGVLLDNLEYHLLGNHLLENGFSLLFGAYYFQDEVLYIKAKEILISELDEQILSDGAHFELSPMYHQIMLFRVLDCINLLKHNSFTAKNEEETNSLHDFLEDKAKQMLMWLENITFSNGDIPHFNDSTDGIAPSTKALVTYAKKLGILHTSQNVDLGASGYRKIIKETYECIVDVGKIGPDYIPGHAHADTFTFVLYLNHSNESNPFIVDTGLSTYEQNERRTNERSTYSHNTIEVENKNSSDIWGAFRVANRVRMIQLDEENDKIVAKHDGYKANLGILHTRKWEFYENEIIIKDHLNKSARAIARLHFHPDITENIIREKIHSKNASIDINHYTYAQGFNKSTQALVAEISFEQELEVRIDL